MDMTEELQTQHRLSGARAVTLRDIASVFFRHKKIFVYSFTLVLSVGLLYRILCPSYQAEMKILVGHGRIDPAVTPTQTPPPLLDRTEVSEEELNSEVELLKDEDILRNVALTSGLANQRSWVSWLLREDREQQISHAVKRLAAKINVQVSFD